MSASFVVETFSGFSLIFVCVSALDTLKAEVVNEGICVVPTV